MAAHMFVFYFGIVADITPPVCLAAMAGAAIAKADPMKTGVQATKLAIAAFIVPYIFVFSPGLLMINTTFLGVVQMLITSVTGMIGVGVAVEGWYWTRMTWWERIIALVAGLMLIDPGTVTDVAGIFLMGLLTFWQYRQSRANRSLLENAATAAD
jgi:TRAP-type uncharacterized transport system fused permease subunit